MRRIWIIVVLLASFYTSSTRAQQCADDLFRPLPAQPAYNGLAPTYDAIGGLNWWYNIAEMFVDELWPDLPYGATLVIHSLCWCCRQLLNSTNVIDGYLRIRYDSREGEGENGGGGGTLSNCT